jgi:Mce-associated membrane protein
MAGKEDEMNTGVADSDVSESETAAVNTPQPANAEATTGKDSRAESAEAESSKREGRKVSISLRALLIGTVIVALIAGIGVVTWMYFGERAKVEATSRQAADDRRAEQIALDYAVGAAKIDAKDLGPWKANLVKGTTRELKTKLDQAATSMEQILVPLQWDSSAVPLVAKVRSNANGIYVVDTFVGVTTKTVQAPDGLASTATYSVTIDGNHDWQISEVGGVGSVIGQK